MKIYYLKITLILIICISPYKIKAHKNITINSEVCQMTLLSHESVLSIFFEAIREDNTDKLLTFKNMIWDLHTSYQNGRILLHYAAILGKSQAIDILVSELGIDVNIQEPETGRTALHHAVLNTDPSSRLDTIYILITLGAHVHILDNEGYKASQYVEDKERPFRFIYSEEQKKKTVELTLPPYNIIRRELLKLLQISSSTVSYWFSQYRKDHDIETQQQDYQEKKARVIHLIITENKTQRQAAEEVGVSEPIVSNWINQHRKDHNIKTQRQNFQEKKIKAIHLINTEDMTHAQAAEEVGVSERAVSDWVNQPYPSQKETDKNKAIEMSESGMNAAEIARALGKPPRTVRRWIHEYKRYSQLFRDHAAKMFIENGMDKEEIIRTLNIHISIETLNIWIDHYKEREQKEEIETNSQEINELQDDNSEEDTFDQLNRFYSEEAAAIAIVERNLSLRDTIEIANENHLDLELLKLHIRNYRYR